MSGTQGTGKITWAQDFVPKHWRASQDDTIAALLSFLSYDFLRGSEVNTESGLFRFAAYVLNCLRENLNICL